MIQDIAPHRLINHYNPEIDINMESIIFSFHKNEVLVRKEGDHYLFPTYQEVREQFDYRYLFSLDDTTCFLAKDTVEMDGFSYVNIQELRTDEKETKPYFYAMITAYQLNNWYRNNRYCGRCGHEMIHDQEERAVVCPHCHHIVYPKIVPAVIVGVINGEEILLTRYAKGFAHNALIAGFTEIGETLEECVQREVYEEVGLKVKNIRYYKSQPWGFVDDLLVGFYCEVDGDPTIDLDTSELKSGIWTKREDIVLQPDELSLTNEMMKMFKESKIG